MKKHLVQMFMSLLVCSFCASAQAETPKASPATIEAILNQIAGDDTQGRDNLTSGNTLARSRLIAWLETQPFTPAGSLPQSFEQPFNLGTNLIAIYYPPGTTQQLPQILIGAHHDGLGFECTPRVEAASSVCNGASDNAGGVAAAMAAMEALVGNINVPVALALWDAEEDSRDGSEWWVANPTFDPSALKVYLNLDIIGLNLFRGLEKLHIILGSETGGAELQADVDTCGAQSDLMIRRSSYSFGRGRSDMDSFVDAGYELPFVFASEGDGSVYHTTADEIQYLNLDKIKSSSEFMVCMAQIAASSSGYDYQAPPPDPLLPIYEDTILIRDVLEQVYVNAQINELTFTQRQKVLRTWINMGRIAAEGESTFNPIKAIQVGNAGVYVLDLSSELPFIP